MRNFLKTPIHCLRYSQTSAAPNPTDPQISATQQPNNKERKCLNYPVQQVHNTKQTRAADAIRKHRWPMETSITFIFPRPISTMQHHAPLSSTTKFPVQQPNFSKKNIPVNKSLSILQLLNPPTLVCADEPICISDPSSMSNAPFSGSSI